MRFSANKLGQQTAGQLSVNSDISKVSTCAFFARVRKRRSRRLNKGETNYTATVRKFRTVKTMIQFHRRPKRLISTNPVDKAVRNMKILLSFESLHGHDSERGRFALLIPVRLKKATEFGASP
jgi:hypothetical protein